MGERSSDDQQRWKIAKQGDREDSEPRGRKNALGEPEEYRSSGAAVWLVRLLGSLTGPVALILLHDVLHPSGARLLQEVPSPANPIEFFELLFVIPFGLYVAFVAWFRFGVVEFVGNWIWVEQGEKTRRTSWHDVKSFIQIPFCTPPVYRLAFKDGKRAPTYFIMTVTQCATVGFWSWDLTGFRRFALQRLKQARDDEDRG